MRPVARACSFRQGLTARRHYNRQIMTGDHCFGCTAVIELLIGLVTGFVAIVTGSAAAKGGLG
jgi:hypothetical protein